MSFILEHASFILETLGILASLAYVICNIRQQMATWVFGLAGYILYVFIFAFGHLYASALLSGASCLFMIYGWYMWSKKKGTNAEPLRVTVYSWQGRLAVLGVSAVLSALMYFLIGQLEGAAFLLGDAIIAGTSLVGLYVAARKKLETWYIWIAVNILAVTVYFSTGLYGTTALYALFLGLSFYGLWEWRSSFLKAQNDTTLEAVPVNTEALKA